MLVSVFQGLVPPRVATSAKGRESTLWRAYLIFCVSHLNLADDRYGIAIVTTAVLTTTRTHLVIYIVRVLAETLFSFPQTRRMSSQVIFTRA